MLATIIVSVINYKGGDGNTTAVANLSAELAWRGHHILLIDLDPQASLTFSFLSVDLWRRDYADSRTIKNWFDAFIDSDQNGSLRDLIIRPPRVNDALRNRDGHVDLICSHLALINIDLELATRLGGGTIRQSRNNFLRVHSRLRVGLDQLDEGEYDFVLIDCPPNFNVVTKTAIVAGDHILVPAIPDYLSTLGIDQLNRHVTQLVGDFNDYSAQGPGNSSTIAPDIIGVIPTMINIYGGQPVSIQRQFISQLRREGNIVFVNMIRRDNSKYGGASQYGVPVVLQGESGGTYLDVLKELEEMTTEFLTLV